jgi:hypothetical protein
MNKIDLYNIIEYLEKQLDYLREETSKGEDYNNEMIELINYINFLGDIYNYQTYNDLPSPDDFDVFGFRDMPCCNKQNKETGYILVHSIFSNDDILLKYDDYDFYSDVENDTKLPLNVADNQNRKYYIKETPIEVLELIRKDKR